MPDIGEVPLYVIAIKIVSCGGNILSLDVVLIQGLVNGNYGIVVLEVSGVTMVMPCPQVLPLAYRITTIAGNTLVRMVCNCYHGDAFLLGSDTSRRKIRKKRIFIIACFHFKGLCLS